MSDFEYPELELEIESVLAAGDQQIRSELRMRRATYLFSFLSPYLGLQSLGAIGEAKDYLASGSLITGVLAAACGGIAIADKWLHASIWSGDIKEFQARSPHD